MPLIETLLLVAHTMMKDREALEIMMVSLDE